MRVEDPCSCSRVEWDQVCETVRFSLRPVDCAECCKPYKCELACDCGDGPCCKEKVGKVDPRAVHDRSVSDGKASVMGIDPEPIHEGHDPGRFLGHGPVDRRDEKQLPPLSPSLPRGGCRCLCDHLTKLEVGGESEMLCLIEEPCARVRVDLRNG